MSGVESGTTCGGAAAFSVAGSALCVARAFGVTFIIEPPRRAADHGFPPLRRKNGARMGHGASVEGTDWGSCVFLRTRRHRRGGLDEQAFEGDGGKDVGDGFGGGAVAVGVDHALE